MRISAVLLLPLLLLGLAATADAAPYTVSATDYNTRSAEVTFEVSGNTLIVTLTNTSSSDVLVPTDVLTGVFFTLGGDPTLTPVSAALGSGSVVYFGSANGGDVGGEWAYEDDLSGVPFGSNEGISSTGLGYFGSDNRFGTTNLQGPDAVDGLQYGITSAGDDPTTGNKPVTGKDALIKNQVIFTLSGLPTDFELNSTTVTQVWFQYGTSLDEGSRIPEPTGMVLCAVAGALFLVQRRRRR